MSSRKKFEQLFNNELEIEEAREFLIELYQKGESSEDIAIASEVMRENSIKLPISKELQDRAIDIVGTGGDQSGSFNISSTSALLLSSMGCVVAKHGNRSITSKSGSADMLEELGINLNISVENQIKMLDEVGFCFIFAMNHHPAMKHIMPIRKSIAHRTIFNILGPLTNPSGAKKYLLGVFDPSFIDNITLALKSLGTTRAFVVSSDDGMDEISISTTTQYGYLNSGKIIRGVIDPQEYGFKLAPKEAILGGDASLNAVITKDIISGLLRDPKRDIVVLNSAYALFVDGKARDIKEAIEMIETQIDSGKADAHLKKIIKFSKNLS
ncbi:Anthranilate phosphoribosyltransferase [hydrothermal vent metagenome]|uniref:anthranilate phosphoribosyltransferase n=1 Tax=hydrothermal vent metagenome TaxID=652676 RepID=A0A1W1EK88_9ZZZZ